MRFDNRWRFEEAVGDGCTIHFFIDYEFKSRILGALMGSMFDRAFRMFSEAFEKRAEAVYRIVARRPCPDSLTDRRSDRSTDLPDRHMPPDQ